MGVERLNIRQQAFAPVEDIQTENLILQNRLALQMAHYSHISKPEHRVAFNPNLLTFAEAQAHNVAHNRSVYITDEGNLMNHLSHNQGFGNVNQMSLRVLIENEAFRAQWHLHNDAIEGCRTCPYRYVCVDTSEVINSEGLFYKKDKCGLL